jgi:co-chaperonin GroES (HSP10)
MQTETTKHDTEPAPPPEPTIRDYADNVVIRLEPLPEMSQSGRLHLPQNREERRVGSRRARVVAVGPGHTSPKGLFIPTQVRQGELVLVDVLAGQDYSLDLNVPRHNKATEWGDERGQFRIVREDEILCVIDAEEAAS